MSVSILSSSMAHKKIFLITLILFYFISIVIALPASFHLNISQFPLLERSELDWPAACKGNSQSPIDIPSSTSPNVTQTNSVFRIIRSYYKPISDISVENFDNTKFKLDIVDGGDILVMKNNITYSYDLSDIHFHITSEHSFNGNNPMLEMHLVHYKDFDYVARQGISKDPDTNTILYIAVMFDIGSTFNSFIESLDLVKFNPVKNVNLTSFVDPNKNYFYYSGGITTPPCTETVNWVIMEKIETMTRDQMGYFKNLIISLYTNGNARITQKLNNRPIYYVKNTNSGCFLKFTYSLIILILVIFI